MHKTVFTYSYGLTSAVRRTVFILFCHAMHLISNARKMRTCASVLRIPQSRTEEIKVIIVDASTELRDTKLLKIVEARRTSLPNGKAVFMFGLQHAEQN